MSTGKGGGGGGKGGSFAPNQSYTPVASGHGYGYYNPQQPLGSSAYNPQMDAYGSTQRIQQPMAGYYNQYVLPGSNYQPYQPPAPQPAPQPYQPFQPPAPQPQPQPNPGYFNNYNPFSSPFSNQGGHYNTFGEGYGNSYAHFTPDYGGQQNFYEPTPNYFGRPVQNPFEAPSYNYSTEPDESVEDNLNPALDPVQSVASVPPPVEAAPSMPILDYQQPTVQQSYEQAIAGRQQPQYVAPEPRIYGHQRATQMPILDSADQANTSAPDPGFDGYDPNMYYQPMLFGGIYL